MNQQDTAAPRRRGLHRRAALKAGASGVLAASVAAASGAMAADERVSKFGAYKGYSKEAYDGWVRTSIYMPVRDGTKLAVDIYRPTMGGKLHTERLPAVFQFKRYQRAIVRPDGSLVTTMSGKDEIETRNYVIKDMQRLLKHGYVIVSADRRGTGSSFGASTDLATPQDSTDGYDIIEWLAKQPWCTSKIGMFGGSYEGEIQLRVAGSAPPHLRCITPEVSPFDWYWTVAPGGIVRTSQVNFAKQLRANDTDPNNGPVDADKDRSMLKAALAGHEAHNDYSAPAGKLPFYDSKNPVTGEQSWLNRHGGHYAPTFAKSGIAAYHMTGWFSNVSIHQLTWYLNQKNGPKKLLIGPWAAGGARTEAERSLWAVEFHRFFDYWLKGVQNGIMAEPAIHSSIPSSHTRNGAPWKGMSAAWPRPDEQRTEYFFDGGPTGTAKSVNDGKLTRKKPAAGAGKDDLQVRYDCWYKGGCEPAEPGQPAANHADFDAQGLTYTTEPVPHDVEITGHGEARLWVTSTADDGDFFLKVQDVDPAGASGFIAQGTLRASHRTVGQPPYDYLGPWQRNHEADMKPIPKGAPTELHFGIFPTSYIVKKGHRIRITVTGSDLDTGPSPQVSPAPVISLYRSASHASSVTLPIIPPKKA